MDSESISITNQRHFEVDVEKAFVIVVMGVIHVYEVLSNIDVQTSLPTGFFRIILEFLAGPLGAPVFMFAMGIGMIFTRHDSPEQFIRRGIRLFIAGYVLNFFRFIIPTIIDNISGAEHFSMAVILALFLNVDIFQFAGLSFVLMGLLKKARIRPLWILLLAILMQAAGIQYSPPSDHSDIFHLLLGLLVYTGDDSSFPLMLWFVYPAAGMVYGGVLKKTSDMDSFYKKILIVCPLILAAVVMFFVLTGYEIRNTFALADDIFYRQDIYHLIFTLPLILIAFAVSYFTFHGIEQTKAGRFILYCSTNLNVIYVVQWLLVAYTFESFLFIGINQISMAYVVPVGLLIIAVAIGISVIWNRVRGRN